MEASFVQGWRLLIQSSGETEVICGVAQIRQKNVTIIVTYRNKTK